MSDIDDYIRKNQSRYTREALDEQLRAAGHDPGAIAAAWARLGDVDDRPAPVRPRSAAEWIGRLVLIAIIAVPYGYLGFLGIVGVSFVTGYPRAATGLAALVADVVMIAFGVAMLIAFLFVARRIVVGGTIGGRGWTVTGSVGIAFVLLLGICGACIAGALGAAALGSATR